MMKKTAHRSAVAMLVVALAVEGCTGGPASTPGVATASSTSAHPTGSPNAAEESDYDKALRYTRCMTALGDKVPDPVEGKPLQITAKPLGEGDGWQAESPNYAKCKHYLPATWPVKVDPQDLALAKMFAECMRKNGIDYPMPDENGVVAYPADPTAMENTQYYAAQNSCSEIGKSGRD
jgi:hypothetical protein